MTGIGIKAFCLPKQWQHSSLKKYGEVDNFPDFASPTMGLLEAFFKLSNVDQHDFVADLYGLM